MARPKLIIITADFGQQRVLSSNGARLAGACRQCGTCCAEARPDCEHLRPETQDGIPMRVCAIYQTRPWFCAFWPNNPADDLPAGCGFWWERNG